MLSKPAYASEPVKSKINSTALQHVMGYFFSLKPPGRKSLSFRFTVLACVECCILNNFLIHVLIWVIIYIDIFARQGFTNQREVKWIAKLGQQRWSSHGIQNIKLSFSTNADYSHLPCVKNHDIEHLYAVVKQRHDRADLDLCLNIQHEWLRPLLRPYQIQGVKWMLQKERYGHIEDNKTTGKRCNEKMNSVFGKLCQDSCE